MKIRKINDDKLLELIAEGREGKECADYFGCSSAAISKRLKRLQPPPKSLEGLTPKEQRFCIEIANGQTQTQAALNSFDCGSLQSAKVIGSQLMDKPEIELAISDLMAEAGLTRRYRLQRLKEHVDSKSADVSLKGLDMSFKLDGSYAPEKAIIVTESYHDISDKLKQLEAEEKLLLEELAAIEEQERRTIDITPIEKVGEN